jgi:hypothetical protein
VGARKGTRDSRRIAMMVAVMPSNRPSVWMTSLH